MTYTPTRESLGSYGGYPLQSPKQELENCAENELDSSPFLDKANTFSFTLGEEPGRGYLLMLASDVANLTSQDPYELVMGIEDRIDNTDAKTARYVTLPSIIFVRAINIYPGIEDDDNALMIVEVADKRHWLQQTIIDRQYNVPTIPYRKSTGAEYIPSTLLKIDSTHYRPWTTQEILADIWQHMPSAIAGFSPPVPDNVYALSPTYVSERHQYNCVSALDAYCDVLTRLGCSLAYDPIDDKFYIVQSSVSTNTSYGSSTHGFSQDANAFTTFKSVWLNSEQNVDNDYSGFIPEKVVVCFNANYPSAAGDAYHSKPYYKIEYTWATWAAANPTPATGHTAKTGTVEIIWGDLDARWSSLTETILSDSLIQSYSRSDFTNATSPNTETALSSPTNLTSLTARATELGSLFYFLRAKTGGALTQDTYEGCCPFRLTGQVPVHRITWYDIGDGWMTDVDFMRDMPEFFLKPRDIKARDVHIDTTAEGRMLTTLYPAVVGLTCATKATFVRWIPNNVSVTPYTLKEETDHTGTVIPTTIVNRDTGLTVPANSYIVANWVNGEWRPVHVGHAVASDGTPCCSCNESTYFTLPGFTITCGGSTNNVLTAQLMTNPVCASYFPDAPCVDCEYYFQGSAMSPTYGLDTHLIADLIESPKCTWTLSITYSGLCSGVAKVLTATYTCTTSPFTCPTLTMTLATHGTGETWPSTLTLTPH